MLQRILREVKRCNCDGSDLRRDRIRAHQKKRNKAQAIFAERKQRIAPLTFERGMPATIARRAVIALRQMQACERRRDREFRKKSDTQRYGEIGDNCFPVEERRMNPEVGAKRKQAQNLPEDLGRDRSRQAKSHRCVGSGKRV